MVLCDFFPLYDFPKDVCAASKNIAEGADNDETSESKHANVSKIAYGFQRHHRPSMAEFILCAWVFTLLCEEIRQVISYNLQLLFFST